jgi:hypothetical protein
VDQFGWKVHDRSHSVVVGILSPVGGVPILLKVE